MLLTHRFLRNRDVGSGFLYLCSLLLLLVAGCDSTELPPERPSLTSIEITPGNSSIAAGTSQNFTATGVYADSSTRDITSSVTWHSSDADIIAIANDGDNEGFATAMEPGNVTITATDTTSEIRGQTTITVTSAILTELAITPSNPTIAQGVSQQFTATGTFSDSTTQDVTASVDWQSSDSEVATVDNAGADKGSALGVAQGQVTITAAHTASGISASTNLTITSADVVSIEITPDNPSLSSGATQQFTAMAVYSDSSTQDITSTVTWTSSDTDIATITNDRGSEGLARGVSQGSVTITATDPASGIIAETTLRVTGAELSSIEITPVNASVVAGSTRQFTATGRYSDDSTRDITTSVTWSSSNSDIATISNATSRKGEATGVASGTVTITATDPESGSSAETTLDVSGVTLTSIRITPTNPSISLGDAQQFTATGTFSDSTTENITAQVTWSSADSGIATISNASGSEGLATGDGEGTVIITAQHAASGLSTQTTLRVTGTVLMSIEIAPTNTTVQAGFTQQFTATGTYSDGGSLDMTASVTWSSSDGDVATISNAPGREGLATGVDPGSVTITASDSQSGLSDGTTLNVIGAELTSLEISPANSSITLGASQQFVATGSYSDGSTRDVTDSVQWDSSDNDVVQISNAPGREGLAQSLSFGIVTVTARDSGSGISADTSLTVSGAILSTLSISPSNATVALGDVQQFTATGTYSDASTQDLTSAVTWNSSNTNVATVSNADNTRGLAESVGEGFTTITALDLDTNLSAEATLLVQFVQPPGGGGGDNDD